MVAGIGVDIIEISRIRDAVHRWGDRFLGRIFTPDEIAYAHTRADMHQHLAARFAAKEAVSKAIGSGWAGSFRWKDVEVANEPSGRPVVRLHGALGASLTRQRIHLSLSHSHTHVVAMAVLEDGQA